ncbi:hypothetical protein [Pseudophaeobacter sp.]|uniref:hypothetical protein n=1 Tax=Pseudophaeobacter sp. TaxID=1971739 RepID=UPI0032971BD9
MLKSHDQMWTRLSRLHKEFPAWIAASFAVRPAASRVDEEDSVASSQPAPAGQDTPEQLDAPAETAAEPPHIPFADSLLIPICEEGSDTKSRHALQDRGQFLARQERWSDLSQLIREADQNHSRTSGGLPAADLLAYGARADVVNAVEHALEDRSAKPASVAGEKGEDRILIDGVMALEALRRDHRQDSYLTAIVALAHIDIAWIWRGAATEEALAEAQAEAHLRRANAHFERAATLLQPLQKNCQNSAFLAAAQCALYAGQNADTLEVADAYGALIDQNPENPRPMRALGAQMLPRANGSYAALELEARRTAVRTQEEWGAGGYTWVYFDALAIDVQACARVDPDFFLDGLQDILCADPSQEMINLLAAYCSVTLRSGRGQNQQADVNRLKIAEAARWLIRSHLHELHPLIWAHACEGFNNNARITSLRRFAALGQAEALQCIAGIFRDELGSGHKISFTPEGFDLVPE